MSQKRNKIIFLVALVVVLTLTTGLLVEKNKIMKKDKVSKTSFPQVLGKSQIEPYYEQCKSYLDKLQPSTNGRMIRPLQVFCKIEASKTIQITNRKVVSELGSGKTVMMVVDIPKLMNQGHFDAMAKSMSQSPFNLPSKDFYLCVTYTPYFSTIFDSSNKFKFNSADIQRTSCSLFHSLNEINPIGIAAKIPLDDKGEDFGLSIFIPRSSASFSNSPVLSEDQIKSVIGNEQSFIIYKTIFSLPIK